MRIGRSTGARLTFTGLLVVATGLFGASFLERLELLPRSDYLGSARLVSIEDLSNYAQMCLPEPIRQSSGYAELDEDNLFAAFGETSAYAQDTAQPTPVTRPPVRNILDTDPSYSAIAVDTRLNKVYLQDINTWTIRVFDRLDNTPATLTRTEPERVIGGPTSGIQFNTCIYIDPENGDIYSVENDIGDSIAVFAQDADGDVAAKRRLNVTHRAHSIAVDEEKQELYVTINYPPMVEVYRKEASGDEQPLRVLSGETTRLADVHGITIDTKNNRMYVNSWGNISDYKAVGTGRFEAPSITVYPLDASGDTRPLQVIQGPKTQLNWPGAMTLEPESGDLYVTNSVDQSVLVFRSTDQGDVQPRRVIKGRRTGLSYPSSLFLDTKNQELWVSNLGNASATVYPMNATGDAVPRRTIRSAPLGKVSLKFGKTQALAYDNIREEILVPN